jgi:uncharacterized membrane-anchored protein
MGELNLRDFMEIDLFYLGIIILILNEGFVMLRHYSSKASTLLKSIKEKWGWKWLLLHSALDILWICLLIAGYEKGQYYEVILGVVFGAMILFYIPVMIREYKNYGT